MGLNIFEKDCKKVPGDAAVAAGATAGTAAAASAAAIDATTTFVVVKTVAAAEAAAAPAVAPASPGTFLQLFSKCSGPSSSGPSCIFLESSPVRTGEISLLFGQE